MKNDDLIRKLNSVGKQVFVEQFDIFRQYAFGKVTREQSIAILVDRGVSNDSGAAIRVGNAKIIFDNNGELDALGIIIESKRLPKTVVKEALRIINEISKVN